MSFLNLESKNILVTGVANKKSVAFHTGKTLQGEGANVLYSVRSKERKRSVPFSRFHFSFYLSLK